MYDPICGKKLEITEGLPSMEYKRRKYFFCSDRCMHEFERAAERVKVQEAAKVGALLSHGKVRWGLA